MGNETYFRAAGIIRIAMGWRLQGKGRGAKRIWLADEDPLAAWCGVEAIVALAEKARLADAHQTTQKGQP